MESPLAVANFFIKKSFETGEAVTPMKLVKLVYIAHGWHLALTGKPLISEPIQAWKYGPVVKSVYHTFKIFGTEQVTSYATEGISSIPQITDENSIRFLNKIWEVYGKFDGLELSTLTHQRGTPWFDVWHNQGGKHNHEVIIADNLIMDHYNQLKNADRPHLAAGS